MKKATQLVLIFSLFVLASCGQSYNTDFPNPTAKEKHGDVFPTKIANLKGKISIMEQKKKENGGVISVYGEDKISIEIVRSQSEEIANEYVKEELALRIDEYGSHGRARVNGKWSGHGKKSTGAKIYCWQNNEWTYTIVAANQELFDATIAEFKYISAK